MFTFIYITLVFLFKELEHLHLASEVPAAHLYNLMAEYWFTMSEGKEGVDGEPKVSCNFSALALMGDATSLNQ